ncbi:MAG: diphthine--ammonia ligase [archaeon]|nr:diphthine--ammonia ligase [archaeon]
MLGVLFSGGKDSVFTLYYYLEQGWDVKCLISLKSENNQSWMFHTPAIEMAELQSEAIGIPIILQETKGEKEKELIDLEKALKKAKAKYKITGVCVGALLSDYQQERVNRVCHALGLKCFAPLWHKKQEQLLSEIISLGFDVRIAGVASQGLGKDFLGKKINKKTFEQFLELNRKIGFHVGGEGGEYESLVVDGPIFKKKILLVKTKKIMVDEYSGTLQILKAELKKK